MQETIKERVIGVIAESKHVSRDSISESSTFAELGLDSLDGVQILFALEEEFNIHIPDEAGRRIMSVPQAIAGVKDLLGESAVAQLT